MHLGPCMGKRSNTA